MTTENRKVFHAVGMDPVVHEAIKRQAVSRNWNQARYIRSLIICCLRVSLVMLP